MKTALDAFMSKHAEVRETLKEITDAVHDHCGTDPDNVNWNEVGSMVQLARDLGEIRDRLLGLGEYAEAGELVALYRWLQPDEAAPKERVGEKLADVMIFSIRMADVCGIDLLNEVARKIEQNANRYPVKLAHGNARKYTEFDDDQHGTQRR